MRFDVITLFPELFAPHQSSGVTRRAYDSGAIELKLWPLREHADDPHRRVDDRPFGGGPGMVMLAEPLQRALAAVRADRGDHAPLVHFTPTGRPLTQAQVQHFALGEGALLLCARYEGVEALPALVLLDAVARLLPGVLSESSHQADSFSDGLLEGPQYSRPEVLEAPEGPLAVPKVLLSGHHAEIARWRRDQAVRTTALRRPDLIARARAEGLLDGVDEAVLRTLGL